MSAIKNLLYSVVVNVLNVAIPIITVPYTSRVFGVDNIGIVSFAMTYAAYFGLFISLGIPIYGVREVGKYRNDKEERDKIVSELLKILTISTIICTSLYVISIFSIPRLKEEWEFLLVAGVGLVLMPLGVDWYFTGRENLKIIATRSIIVRTLGLIALFTFIRSKEDLILYLILNAIINAGSQVWTFVIMIKKEVTLRWNNLNTKRHVRPVLVLFISSLAISIYTMLDTIMLGFLSDYTEVGYYSSAIKISRLLLPIVTAAAAVALPRISRLYKERNFPELERVANKSFAFMALLAPPMTIGLIAITPKFVPLFFGTEFIGTIPSMMIVSTIILLVAVNNFYGPQLLIGCGKDKVFMYAVLFGTISNFALNLAFIPLWGSVGASVASVIAEIVVTASVIICAVKLLPNIKISYKPLVHSTIASLPMVGFSYIFTTNITSESLCVALIITCSAVTFVIIELFVFKDSSALEMREKIWSKLHFR